MGKRLLRWGLHGAFFVRDYTKRFISMTKNKIFIVKKFLLFQKNYDRIKFVVKHKIFAGVVQW